jgi:hypothetical protein
MDFHIPVARAPADGAAGALDRLPERRHHVLAHALGPVAGESALQGHNSIAVKGLAVGANFDPSKFRRGTPHVLLAFSLGPFYRATAAAATRFRAVRRGGGGSSVKLSYYP